MDNILKTKILFEISQIDKLINDSKPLLDLCNLKKPDFIEMSAAAMVLHSFYNGIENILVLVLKHYDGKIPNGIKWHIELLDRAFISDNNRKQIFSNDIKEKIDEYLKFRHFIRHSYGFQLEWERMEELFKGMKIFWNIINKDIHDFIDNS